MKKLLIATALVGTMGLLAACASDEPATKTTEKPAAEKTAEKPAPKKEVAKQNFRAQFTSGIEDREPVDKLEKITKEEEGRIRFFSEITGQNGNTVYHVWKNGDVEIFRIPFAVGSNKWRVNSNVSMWHYAVGDVALVEIQDEDGNVLDSYSVEVVE